MAHLLITGGCGFFGAWIARKLFDAGHRISVWDLEKELRRWAMILSPEEFERIGFQAVHIDDPGQVQSALAACAPDAVIHLAGLQVPACQADPVAGARVNVIGTLALFEAARSLPQPPPIVYASSAAVFGRDADYGRRAVGDADRALPGTHYGVFKRCNELSAQVFWKTHGLPSVGLRPLTVYGPGRDTGLTSFPTRAIAAAILKQPFEIPFRGPSTYTYAEEVAEWFVAAALRPRAGAPVFTVGGEVADTAAFIAALEQAVPGAKKLITSSGGELPIASHLEDAGLRKAYPGVKRVPLAEGIRRTVAIFQRLHSEGRLQV